MLQHLVQYKRCDVMPILDSGERPAARSSCCSLLACLVRLAPHPPPPPPMPTSVAIPFPRSVSKVRARSRPARLGGLSLLRNCPCACARGRARPHGPETLNTGQGNIRLFMSQTRYNAVQWCGLDVGWEFQGIPRYFCTWTTVGDTARTVRSRLNNNQSNQLMQMVHARIEQK